jgi:ATP-dependent DNA helicase PIF1
MSADTYAVILANGTIAHRSPSPMRHMDRFRGDWSAGDTEVRFIGGDEAKVDKIRVYAGNRSWRDWEPELGPQQKAAYDDIMAGRSCYVTGPGGVGKTVVIHRSVRDLREIGRRVAVSASTGIAAVQAGGMTIHSTLGLGYASSRKEALAKHSAEALTKAAERLCNVGTIIVDEVSMLTGDYITMMDWWLKRVAGFLFTPARAAQPFGGWQVVFVGDHLQLPPVIKDSDKVEHKYSFQSPAWINAGLSVHYLRKGYRQDDPDFKRHLMRLRRGLAPEDTLDYFNIRFDAKLPEGSKPTVLFGTNAEADALNDACLEALPGEVSVYSAQFSGHPGWIESLKKNLPCEVDLRLKPGAEVMFLKNNREAGYVNGTRGVIAGLDNGIRVRTRSSALIDAPREPWEMKNADDVVVASAEQYALRLAFALTVHRSQGSTLDLCEFDPARVFERGQTYVALSRVRNINGLRLRNRLTAKAVRASKACVDYYAEIVRREKESE